MTDSQTSPLHDHALQPNSRMCFGCGLENAAGVQIRFYNDGPNAARAEVTLEDKHQGYPGMAHGGVVATMLDEIMGRTTLANGDIYRLMYTAKMEVRFRRPVPLHQPLTLRGWIEKDRGMVVYAAGSLTLADGTVLAEASGTLMEIPRDELQKMDTEAVGWRVYPLD
jgi:acyl-coenzyme A thioesterase PaaI-like protein